MFHIISLSGPAGRGYPTPEAAAAAFGAHCYAFTRQTGRECAASLYAREEDGQTRYWYDNVCIGTSDAVAIYVPWDHWEADGRTYVGCVHTHPPGGLPRFSGYDVAAFRRIRDGIPAGSAFYAFLVLREGRLLRFVDAPLRWEEEVEPLAGV